MAFFDWNRNGKTDAQDTFLQFNIFKTCTEDKDKKTDVPIEFENELVGVAVDRFGTDISIVKKR